MKNQICMGLIGALCLTACAGPSWKQNITPDSKYKINSIKTELNSACPAPNFMTETQLNDAFADGIKKSFCGRKKCVETITPDTIVMDIFVEYTRAFMGEAIACSESYGASNVSYSFTLSKGDDEFYTRPQTEPMAPSRGLFSNFGRIATQLTFSGGPEQEKADVEYMKVGIAKKIIEDLE